MKQTLTIGLLLLLPSVSGGMIIFQPDTAVASSEFSARFDIGNAIDGSGLPTEFTVDDAHAVYVADNHWTTASNPTFPVSAILGFNTPVTMGQFLLWNHRSDNIADDSLYEVAQFDLILKDSADNVLLTLNDLTATGNTVFAQIYDFPLTGGVSTVEFFIDANQGSSFTGVAEFGFTAIPEPSTAFLTTIAGSMLMITLYRKRTTSLPTP